jgi:4-methyl-5(b-hydroxyethyl)-thiazole monophosphate biosynthesis
MPRVLAILAEGFEEIEAVTPIDLLRRAGAEMTIASLTDNLAVTGRCGLTLRAETTLGLVLDQTFDCIFLPGGPGVRHLRADPRVLDLLRAQHAAQRWIVAICAAPTGLLDAGVLAGRRHTAHFSVQNELPELAGNDRVVVDGSLITARGAGTALDFGLALVEHLISPESAAEISRSICA